MSSFPVEIIDRFVDEEKCVHLILTYQHLLTPSTVFTLDCAKSVAETRTSYSCFLAPEDAVVQWVTAKVALTVGMPASHIERLQLVRYETGQQFKAHCDYYIRGEPFQRVHTVLVYLNDIGGLENGGATCFPCYGMKVYPRRGRAVWFRNVDEEGKIIPESLHAGEPVLGDTPKFALNVWVLDTEIK